MNLQMDFSFSRNMGWQLLFMDQLGAVRMTKHIKMHKGISGEVYNVGGSKQISIKELAKLILKLTNRKNGIVFTPHFIEDHNARQPALEKIHALGWRQQVSLENGLRLMLSVNGFHNLLSQDTHTYSASS